MIDMLNQVGGQMGGLPQAAYTITINQNSAAIDESTGLTVNDQDTEKTKFWKMLPRPKTKVDPWTGWIKCRKREELSCQGPTSEASE